jgi:hypothetical protein
LESGRGRDGQTYISHAIVAAFLILFGVIFTLAVRLVGLVFAFAILFGFNQQSGRKRKKSGSRTWQRQHGSTEEMSKEGEDGSMK